MVILQGEVWWADLPPPRGSEPGYRRPVVVVQSDLFNESELGTVVCVPLTSNLNWRDRPGHLFLSSSATGLSKDSVAQATCVFTADRRDLTAKAGHLSAVALDVLFLALDEVLGR